MRMIEQLLRTLWGIASFNPGIQHLTPSGAVRPDKDQQVLLTDMRTAPAKQRKA
jgi:hypothetical protein